ncbi:hypothetical protein GCM10020258_00900 [Sphingomonas yabuuchiae]
MDARPGYDGYAAFGRVVAGMDTVKKILAKPSGGGQDAMKGQMIFKPVTLINAKRLDGKPQPTKEPKMWLYNFGDNVPSSVRPERSRRPRDDLSN